MRGLIDKAAAILRDHPVNRARREAGKPEATSVWFWGQGTRPAVPTLRDRFGVDGSVISAVDLVNGLGRLAGTRSNPGAGRDRLSRYRLRREGALRARFARSRATSCCSISRRPTRPDTWDAPT